jgi:hypothetical protein
MTFPKSLLPLKKQSKTWNKATLVNFGFLNQSSPPNHQLNEKNYFLFYLLYRLLYSLSYSLINWTPIRRFTLGSNITPHGYGGIYFITNWIWRKPDSSHLSGSNTTTYKVLTYCQQVLQIDLQPPTIDKVSQDGEALSYKKRGQNAYMITLRKSLQNVGDINQVKLTTPLTRSCQNSWTVVYPGKKTITAIILWQPLVRDWEQVWWPCKDHMYRRARTWNGLERDRAAKPDGRNQTDDWELSCLITMAPALTTGKLPTHQ